MGDGSLAFAPQWLKTGHTSLRNGTQGGAASSSSKEESGTVPWRESVRETGSRLGLGAGADRDSSEQKLSNNHSRRHNNAFPDRLGSNHTRGERVLGSRPSQSRVLSDRELVEQTSSLKIRSGRGGHDGKFAEDSFSSIYNKDSYTPRGTSKGNSRKNATSQRPLTNRGHERDFGVLNRGSTTPPHLSPSGILLSPRQDLKTSSVSLPTKLSASDQPWTSSRLTDTPPEFSKPSHSVPPLDLPNIESQPFSSPRSPIFSKESENAVETRNTPRMADTIAQAQANANQEQEALRAEKLRKEQLALRQSKQLIPVLASGKPKQSSNVPQSPGLALRKSAGLEPLKPSTAVMVSTVRKEEDGVNGLRKSPKPLPKENLSNHSTPVTKRVSREKERLSFFNSLRSMSSTEARPDSEASSQFSQEASLDGRKSQPEYSALNGLGKDSENSRETNLHENESLKHASSTEPELLAQEVAFMKSLGWDGDLYEDDAEGGLTDEEIAAFYAKKAQTSFLTPMTIPAKGSSILKDHFASKTLPQAKGKSKQPFLNHSFHSAMEFSDSDVE